MHCQIDNLRIVGVRATRFDVLACQFGEIGENIILYTARRIWPDVVGLHSEIGANEKRGYRL